MTAVSTRNALVKVMSRTRVSVPAGDLIAGPELGEWIEHLADALLASGVLDEPPVAAVSTRDALAKALHDRGGDTPLPMRPATCGSCRDAYEQADALFASGAVVDAATLADDEDLLWAVARNDYDMHAGEGAEFDGDWVTQAEQILRALAAALTERVS